MKRVFYIFLAIITAFIIFVLFLYEPPKETVLSVFDLEYSVFEKFLIPKPKVDYEASFHKLLEETKTKSGTYSIYVKNLKSGNEYKYNQNELFYGASLYKVPLAAAVYKMVQENKLSLDNKITLSEEDIFEGTGTLKSYTPGERITLDIILKKLLKESDNTAQNMLTKTITPVEVKKAFDLITMKNYFYAANTITLRQYINFLENFIFSSYLKSKYKNLMLETMSDTFFDNRIHRGLSSDIKFSHKIGNWPKAESWHDCGIAQKDNKQILICVMSRNTTYEEFLEVCKSTGEFVNILF